MRNLLTIVLILIIYSNKSYTQSYLSPSFQINRNELDLDVNEDYSTFKLIDSLSLNNKLFALGEEHYAFGNFELQLKLFKYLYKKAEARFILVERGFGVGYLTNKYLESGDETLLSEIRTFSFGELTYFRELYKFYQSLEISQRFKFIGIDFERHISATCTSIDSLLPKTEAPEEIKDIISTYIALNRAFPISKNKLRPCLDTISRYLNTKRALFKEYLGENFDDFEQLLISFVKAEKFSKLSYKKISTIMEEREQFLTDNIIKVFKESKGKNIFIVLGSFHTPLYRTKQFKKYFWTSCIARINNNNELNLQNKICSILSYNSTSFIKNDYQFTKKLNDTLSRNAYKHAMTLFKLKDSDYPMKNDSLNNFQFVIFNKYNKKNP